MREFCKEFALVAVVVILGTNDVASSRFLLYTFASLFIRFNPYSGPGDSISAFSVPVLQGHCFGIEGHAIFKEVSVF